MALRKVAGSLEPVAMPEAAVVPAAAVIRAVRHFSDAATNRDYKPGEVVDWPAAKIERYLSVEPPLIEAFTE